MAATADRLAQAPVDRTRRPFLDHRQATLDYHGWDDELAGLTECRIGWFGPTNLNDPLTGDLWWSATFAVEQANSELRSPNSDFPPFRLVPRWSENVWGTGVSQLTRMVYEETPLALIGSIDSASTHLAEQVVAKANLPLVSPIATDPSVTLAGVPWAFSCAPSDTAVARVLVEDVLRTLASLGRGSDGVRAPPSDTAMDRPALAGPQRGRGPRVALLTATDHESRMTARALLREFARHRQPPDFRFDIQPGAQDVSRPLAALAVAQPIVILIVAGVEDAARWLRAIRQSLPEPSASSMAMDSSDQSPGRESDWPGPVVFGTHSMGRTRFRELAGPASEGVRFPLPCPGAVADARATRFVEAFVAARGHPPDWAAALTYDATRLLIERILQAGASRARIRSALAGLCPWQGMGGTISFDGTGQNTRTNVSMATWCCGLEFLKPQTCGDQVAF